MKRRVPGEHFRVLAWALLALLSATLTAFAVGFVSGTCSSPGACEVVNVRSDPGQLVISLCLVSLTTYFVYRASLEVYKVLKNRNGQSK